MRALSEKLLITFVTRLSINLGFSCFREHVSTQHPPHSLANQQQHKCELMCLLATLADISWASSYGLGQGFGQMGPLPHDQNQTSTFGLPRGVINGACLLAIIK
jgi:hypothetical protein